jgi:hypothetical protein
MDVLTVSKKSFAVGRKIPYLNTKIWTERFFASGDFELHTFQIEKVRNMLPELSLITLRDTEEIMVVEKHLIQQAQDGSGANELMITGRSMEAVLMEMRQWHNGPYGKVTKMAKNYTVRQAVEVFLWNMLVNDTGNDVVNTSASAPISNVIPNLVISDSVPPSSDGPTGPRRVQSGPLLDQIQQFLSSGKLGIRAMRPIDPPRHGRRVDPHADGTFDTTSVDFIHARLDVYQGRDKTGTVSFTFKNGDLVEPTYAMDSTNFKTGVYVDGDASPSYVTDPDALSGSNTGWNKRDGYVDGGQKDTGVSDADFHDSLTDKGLHYLRTDGKHIKLVSTQVSPSARAKYGHAYRLGDRVHVQGQYGISQDMWVTEYIRSEDTTNGEVAYPTLSVTAS